jgi:hypothetical protein
MITSAGIVLEEGRGGYDGNERLVFHGVVYGSTAGEQEHCTPPLSNPANLTVFFDKNEAYLFRLVRFMTHAVVVLF